MNNSLRLIVFLVPPQKFVSGGVLSIFDICSTSREFSSVHHSKVLLSVYPNFKSYGVHDLIDSKETVYSFDDVVKLGKPSYLQLHIPEYAANELLPLFSNYEDYLKNISELRINIMNQNVLMMPRPEELAGWFRFTPKITQTTAHDKYSTQELSDKYDTPLHHFSVYVDPRQYEHRDYEKKEKIILLSPDKNKLRESIIKKLVGELPDYKLITVQKMRYEDYKALVSKAKYVITFGEGFDGYLVEPCFSGTLTFTVYNDDFFPDKAFAMFDNVYGSYSEMLAKIIQDIKHLDNKERYEKVVNQNFKKITEFYKYETYKNNIKRYYQGKFDFIPSKYSAERLMGRVITEKDQELARKNAVISQQSLGISKAEQELQEQIRASEAREASMDTIIKNMSSSFSWRVTQPLRSAKAKIKK